MKTKNLRIVALTIIAGAALFSTSCKKENILDEKVKADGTLAKIGDESAFELDGIKFSTKIETYMAGKVAGYGYAIYHDRKLFSYADGGGGWARKKQDAPTRLYNMHTRQGIANATKFVTALATIAILEKYGLKLNEKIYKYLPSNWKPCKEFKELTFERLLAHRTGLINYGENFSDYRKTVEDGVQLNEFYTNGRDYDNINYGLVTILLPYVVAKNTPLGPQSVILKSLEKYPNELYKFLGSNFINIVRQNVFKPGGIEHWDVMDYCVWDNSGPIPASQGTLGYPSLKGPEKGTEKEDERKNGGASGLYISPLEFGRIQFEATQGDIVSKEGYKSMRDLLLGFDGAANGKYGRYTWKNGSAKNQEAMIIDFGRTQVVVFANSTPSLIGDDPHILINAYETSWVEK
jgi:hypothetical protein